MKKMIRRHDPIESATWVIVYLMVVGTLGAVLHAVTGWEFGNCMGIIAMLLIALVFANIVAFETKDLIARNRRRKDAAQEKVGAGR